MKVPKRLADDELGTGEARLAVAKSMASFVLTFAPTSHVPFLSVATFPDTGNASGLPSPLLPIRYAVVIMLTTQMLLPSVSTDASLELPVALGMPGFSTQGFVP